MANPSKRAGTEFENRLLARLKGIWPDIDRAKTNNPSNDFHGAPIPIEAKRRGRWEIPAWVRSIRRVAGSDQTWALFCATRDLRTVEGREVGTVMVVDWEFGLELLDVWANSSPRED